MVRLYGPKGANSKLKAKVVVNVELGEGDQDG